MAEKKILKGLRFPVVVMGWILKKIKKSKRTFSAEVIHQLEMRMENERWPHA